jgi:peroxiredoxin
MTATAQRSGATAQAGQVAPDFTLSSTAGQQVSLSALRGSNVLVAFFPLAFTSTCTAELCEMRDDFAQFDQRGAVVLPVSVDSVPTLKEYKSKYDMRVELLSDFKREASRAFGVLNEEKFFANRSYFLIDRDGVVRWSHVETNNSERRPDAEILREIDRLA